MLIFSPLFVFTQTDTTKADTSKYPFVSLYEGDSVIVFAFKQGQEMAKRNEQRKECEIVSESLQLEVDKKDTITAKLQEKINNFEMISDGHQIVIENQKDLLDICEDEKEVLKDEIKKQKRGKVVAILAGIALVVVAILL